MTTNERIDAIMKEKGYPKYGYAYCLHHDFLFEYCYDFHGRIRDFIENKPAHELETRLKNFTWIPNKLLPVGFLEAWFEADKAWSNEKLESERYKARTKVQVEAIKDFGMLEIFNKLNPANTWNGTNIGWE